MDNLNNGRPSTPDPQCSICLNDLTNKCYSNGCVHLFCFNCLQRWSNTCLQESSSSEPTCPLCKESFKYIYHSFDDLGIFETYTVPILSRLPIPRLRVRPFSELSNGNSRWVLQRPLASSLDFQRQAMSAPMAMDVSTTEEEPLDLTMKKEDKCAVTEVELEHDGPGKLKEDAQLVPLDLSTRRA